MSDLRPSALTLLPRVIRLRDAASYLGMDRNRFNAEVRPFLTEVPIGKQGVGFDRLELDAWFDDYIARNGRPAQNNDGRKQVPGLFKRAGIWHIDKRIHGRDRGCGSQTGHSSNACFFVSRKTNQPDAQIRLGPSTRSCGSVWGSHS